VTSVNELDRLRDEGSVTINDSIGHGLRQVGLEPSLTVHRLIEIPLKSIVDATSMPWPRPGIELTNAIHGGVAVPPVVVMRSTDRGWGLLDGGANAYAVLGRQRILGYEVLQD
jgi:hypothetical protein